MTYCEVGKHNVWNNNQWSRRKVNNIHDKSFN